MVLLSYDFVSINSELCLDAPFVLHNSQLTTHNFKVVTVVNFDVVLRREVQRSCCED